MKKALCILTAVLCLVGGNAFADRHLEAQLAFSGTMEGQIVSFDLYDQEGSLTAVSSLLPETAVVLCATDTSDLLASSFCYLQPDTIIGLRQKTEDLMIRWLGNRRCEYRTGFFAGDLFDYASNVSIYEFRLSELAEFIREECRTQESDGQGSTELFLNRSIFTAAENLKNYFGDNDPDIRVKCFDEGLYYTIQVSQAEGTVINVSLDRSADTGLRMIVSYRSDGLNCHRYLEYQADSTSVNAVSSFTAGPEETYRAGIKNGPLFSESMTITSGNDGSLSFQFVFESDKLADPVNISGIMTGDPNDALNLKGDIYIRGNENEKMTAEVYLEDLFFPVSFSDKKLMNLNNENENGEIQLEMLSSITAVAAEMIPALPSDYQRLLLSLFSR